MSEAWGDDAKFFIVLINESHIGLVVIAEDDLGLHIKRSN